jgi:hypothetical protein
MPIAGLRSGETERLVERLQEAHRHPTIRGELLVGAIQALGQGHNGRIQERQRQGTPINQREDRLNRKPRRRPRPQQPCTSDCRGELQLALPAGQRVGADQLSHKVFGHVRALGHFLDAVRHLVTAPTLCLSHNRCPRRHVSPGHRACAETFGSLLRWVTSEHCSDGQLTSGRVAREDHPASARACPCACAPRAYCGAEKIWAGYPASLAAWLRSAWAIAGVGPLDAIAAAMGHVEECDR